MLICIIGGGAAGFFAAIRAAEVNPTADVRILEQSKHVLSKVKVSGGGRCNVTNATFSIPEMLKAYPRGSRFIRHALHIFGPEQVMRWFSSRGVGLKTESFGHVFPISDDSQTVIDCLLTACRDRAVQIETQNAVRSIAYSKGLFELETSKGIICAEKVIVASGGSPKRSGFDWLEALGHRIVDPVPSLFTFNMPNERIRNYMGVSVPNATVRIRGTNFEYSGALLITHWGMSGPAVLKLSAYAARALNEMDYRFGIQVNWIAEKNQEVLRIKLEEHIQKEGLKQRKNSKLFPIPERLWLYLLERADLKPEQIWRETGSKGLSRLIEVLSNDTYKVEGKTTFKEEFVTCGGVSLDDIDPKTMQSKVIPGLYFAGEVMDIDAITGGYNFQAAWSTGYLAGSLLGSQKEYSNCT
ncbi:MAG: NAD(P)/FAD-dependent oxidoreductase [Flavobacteriales bacterium]|nr:NAD(P)/FAD-dependent oxidoreductase [Flavobacteriales bacterium]